MDWMLVDGVAIVALGVLFLMWGDIIYGTTGTIYLNSVLLYILVGGFSLTLGVCWLVGLNDIRVREGNGKATASQNTPALDQFIDETGPSEKSSETV
jgi:hypothetical protein